MNQNYFDWQQPLGEFGGWANLSKFESHVSSGDTVLDFGCGGGFLLKNMDCKKKIGVEINPTAAKKAEQNGLEVYNRTKGIPDDSIDVIVSDNALEHTPHPLDELQTLYSKLKPGGKIILVLPCESIRMKYYHDNVHKHLYSWSPMCAGNLLETAGYQLVSSEAYIHKWPRIKYIAPCLFQSTAKYGGRRFFEISCRILTWQ